MQALLQLIDQCPDWQSLYAIDKHFRANGLVLERTLSNRTILCRIENGIPQHGEIFNDYIFVCGLTESDHIQSEAKSAIKEFVQKHAGQPQEIRPAKSYRRNYAFYGQVAVFNEDRAIAAQQIDQISRTIID